MQEQESTRGQKIDWGDDIIGKITDDRIELDRCYRDFALKLKIIFQRRIDEMIKLGCFPTEQVAYFNRDQNDFPASFTDSRDIPLLYVGTHENRLLFLRPEGDLVTSEYNTRSEVDYSRIIDEDSLSPLEDKYYPIRAESILNNIEQAIREAQDTWYGPKLINLNGDD